MPSLVVSEFNVRFPSMNCHRVYIFSENVHFETSLNCLFRAKNLKIGIAQTYLLFAKEILGKANKFTVSTPKYFLGCQNPWLYEFFNLDKYHKVLTGI
jgi:hypothetical protein